VGKLIHLRNTFFIIGFPYFSVEAITPIFCEFTAKRFSGVRCDLSDLAEIDRASLTRSTNSSVDSRTQVERTD